MPHWTIVGASSRDRIEGSVKSSLCPSCHCATASVHLLVICGRKLTCEYGFIDECSRPTALRVLRLYSLPPHRTRQHSDFCLWQRLEHTLGWPLWSPRKTSDSRQWRTSDNLTVEPSEQHKENVEMPTRVLILPMAVVLPGMPSGCLAPGNAEIVKLAGLR